MFDGIILADQTDKDLLGVPVKERTEIRINVEVDLDKVLNVSIHMPSGFAPHHFELIDLDGSRRFVCGEAGHIDQDDEDEHDGGGQCRDRV